ncbi:MAG: HD domain-containing protein [Planctomycetes bacterium]|nr:HD domain-containing protein [Planctomycetota bacterium]
MKKIRIDEALAGQKVARTLYYPNGAAMLAMGATLTPSVLQRIAQFGYRDLYVFEEGAENVDCRDLVAETARAPMARKLGEFFKKVREGVARTAGLGSDSDANAVAERLSSAEVRKLVKQLRFTEAVGGDDLDAFLDAIASEKDSPMVAGAPRTEATHHIDHPLNVAARSVMMGRRLGWTPRECRELCIGALLHDIGYHVLPEEIVRSAAGQALHPVAGYHLLRADTGVSLLAAHCAYQHHERFDGRGFPRRLIGLPRLTASETVGPGYMHRYASVVAIADRFDLLIAGFPDGWAMRDDEAIATMKTETGAALHPEAMGAFLALTPVYPVGLEVEVTGGEYAGCSGIVSAVTAAALDRPSIRLVKRAGVPLPQSLDADTQKSDVPFRPRTPEAK